MKRKSIIFWGLTVLFIFFLSLTILAKEQVSDFRKTNWGTSVEQVKATESLDGELSTLSTLPFFITTKEYDSGTIYTIQAGTFSKERDAQNLAKKINDEGYQTYIVNEKSLYKVQVGEFKSYKEAQSFSDKLNEITGDAIPHILEYEIWIIGKSYSCSYYFLEDKLIAISYAPTEKYRDKNDYIRDYEEIRKILIEKYGKLDEKKLLALNGKGEMYWKHDFYKNDKSKWGLAIAKEDLEYFARWETNDTVIELSLKGMFISESLTFVWLNLVFHDKKRKE